MPRILIPKGSNTDVERGGCIGLTMYDGTEYKADRRGYVDVENPAHIEMIQGSTVCRDVGIRAFQTDFHAKKAGKTCPKCDFSAHSWQKTCPRDGEELKQA